MSEKYGDQAVFMNVYIREAHPAFPEQTAEDADWKAIEVSEDKKLVYHQPKSYEERRALAETACTFLEMKIPSLVDTLDESVGDMYRAWPTRTYLVDEDGEILYRGEQGPRGSTARPAEVALLKQLGLPEEDFVSDQPRPAGGRGRGQRERPAN